MPLPKSPGQPRTRHLPAPSGVAAAKGLNQKGIAFECFEKRSDLGGMWRSENDKGISSAYRSLYTDASCRNLAYPDFPVPDHVPAFLSHQDVLRYLEDYPDRFGVREHRR